MDDTYQDYVNRVIPMTLSATHRQQVQHLQKSAKFEVGKAIPFPGYTLTTPPWDADLQNEVVYQSLQNYQAQLVEKLGTELLIPVPPSSFHITLADLIWENTYRNAIAIHEDFETKICDRIHQSFQQYQQKYDHPSGIVFQLLGLTLFTRGIVVCLAPETETEYEKIRHLRRTIYQNSGLIDLGIEQQYHFTAHITLCYFNAIPTLTQQEQIVRILGNLNDQWIDHPLPSFISEQAQLRQFDDMLQYYRQDHFPILML